MTIRQQNIFGQMQAYKDWRYYLCATTNEWIAVKLNCISIRAKSRKELLKKIKECQKNQTLDTNVI